MISNRKNTVLWLFAVLLSCYSFKVSAQQKKNEIITDSVQLEKLKAHVEEQMDNLKVHDAYIKALGIENPELEKQYNVWMAKHPQSSIIPYAIAKGYLDHESPKARPYLLKAVALNPKFTEAWGGLWIDGERWGDFEVSRGYLAKATESDPSNPNYAFYYASSFGGIDEAKWRQLSLEVAERFPKHERGAQALYWLAVRSKKTEDKLKYFQLLHDRYAPKKFNWSSSGMSGYYHLLLSQNPQKALTLAQELAKDEKEEKEERKQWPALIVQAKTIAEAKNLLDQKKGDEALSVLNSLKLPRRSVFATDFAIMKAKANDLSGRTQSAYDSLVVIFAKAPEVALKEVIANYGHKLGKTANEMDTDIWNKINANAKVATPFIGLKRYMTEGDASLSDFKGKVVLLTYWFPGCGPCRGEFPHFENVVRKFKGEDLAYIGINIVSDQNEYVVPFMKSSGYSFTPLEEVKGRNKGNLDNKNAAPVNFLIDKEGRVIFSNFRTDDDNEQDLELMIKMLLKS